MTAIALPYRQNTDEWLQARLDGIGSSDAPVIAGERGSAVALWLEKTRQVEPEEPDAETQQFFDMGHRLEPIIAEAYTERENRPLRRVNRILQRRDVPWALASLDRVSARKGERRIVELKTNPWSRWGVGEPVPGDVQAQVQHQLWVTGYDVADVAVLVRGYDLKIHTIERDDTFIDNLVYLEREFWRQVETRERPPVDGSDETRRALARMFPAEYGTILPATPEFDELARLLQVAQIEAKAATDREATVKNAIRALLGESAGVAGIGWKITWKKNADSTKTDWEAVADGYRRILLDALTEQTKVENGQSVMRSEGDALIELGLPVDMGIAEAVDAIKAKHTNPVPGPRTLRPWFAQPATTAVEEEAAA